MNLKLEGTHGQPLPETGKPVTAFKDLGLEEKKEVARFFEASAREVLRALS